MTKELWIDRDEAYMWFDVRPTYEALGTEDQVSEHVAKVPVSDETYAAYQAHCLEVQKWQIFLASQYAAEMAIKRGI